MELVGVRRWVRRARWLASTWSVVRRGPGGRREVGSAARRARHDLVGRRGEVRAGRETGEEEGGVARSMTVSF